MSAHQQAAEASFTPANRGEHVEAVTDFIAEQFLGGADEEEEEIPEGEQPDGDEVDGDEPEASDEPTDETDEAPEPIAAPVSWDKDAKGLFEQLPPELQTKVAEREAQRDRAIQSATTEAANARKNAAAEANAALAESQRQYASHLEQLSAKLAPQRPDPAILAQDPQAFYYLQAQYEQAVAQHGENQQRAAQARQEADQREAATRNHELARDHETLSAELGEVWTDTTKRKELLTSLETVGAELGYPVELMGQANPTDILALRRAADWKAKAEKYDKLQGTKMEAVRAAKVAPRVSKPGTASTRAESTSRGRDAAWANVKSSRGRDGDSSAAYLESIGIKL